MRKTDCAWLFLFVATVCTTFSASAETFRNPVRIPTDFDPAGVFVADLNNDGLPDIVWGGYGSAAAPGIVHTLLAQATGGYLPGPTLTVPANVGSVCLPADENGDGIVDLVCPSAYQFTASIYTFPGKGDGSFGTPIITPIPTLPSNGGWITLAFQALADLNGDGVADLIAMSLGGQSGYAMLGDGHGGFTKSSTITGTGTLQVVDMNGDGKADIVFEGGSVWLGKGDGTFTQLGTALPVYNSCVFHDMDSDGKPDAVCGLPETITGDIIGGTQLLVFHSKGDGTFDPTPIKTVTYGDHSNEFNGFGTFLYPITVTDMNADGVPDILAYAGDGLTVILGHDQLAFDTPTHYATGYISGSVLEQSDMQIADLNKDGFPDVVSVGPNGIYISYGRKDGTLDTAPAYEVTQVIGYQTVADFNEDGIPDVAATGDLSIELNLGKGDGTFQAPVALPSGGINFSTPLSATNAHILHGDFNGDHHQDILAVGSSSIYQYDSYVLFGDGTGSFSSPQLVPNSSQIFPAYDSRVVADLNHDGRDDLLGSDDSHLYAFLSNGDGTFTTLTTTVTLENGARSAPVLADFDHDGKLDAVWAAGPSVMVSKGNGDGTFDSTPLSLPIPTSIASDWSGAAVSAGDFDGDGNQDIALLVDVQSGTVASAVFVFYGSGKGTFTSGALAGTFNRAYTGIYAADLNKEGLDDLILKTSGSLGGGYAVGIVDSLPDRAFGPEVNYYAGTGLADISIADLNHDGFVDLLFSNGDYNIRASSVTVLMNQGNLVTGTLTATPEPSNYNQPLTLDAAFVPSSFTPLNGTVTFTIDGKSVGSASISANKASLPISTPIPAGTHALTATWPGNSIYSALTLTGSHQIVPVSSSVTLSSSLNPAQLGVSVTFTASIASTIPTDSTDTVTFYDGQTSLGAAAVTTGQTSTFTTSGLGVGSHSITAVYSGNSNILGSTSSTLTESVVYFVGDFSIQTTPAAATVNGGQAATFQLAIAPSGGFAAPLAFSCSGLPALATCSFSPSTIPTGQGQAALSIQTAGSAQSASLRPSSRAGGAAAILAALVFWLLPSNSRRKRYISLLVLAIFTLATLSITSCGGGSGGSGTTSTPTGSYQVSVTAQTTEPSQNVSHSSVITLTIK